MLGAVVRAAVSLFAALGGGGGGGDASAAAAAPAVVRGSGQYPPQLVPGPNGEVTFVNNMTRDVHVYWIAIGVDTLVADVPPGAAHTTQAYIGDRFFAIDNDAREVAGEMIATYRSDAPPAVNRGLARRFDIDGDAHEPSAACDDERRRLPRDERATPPWPARLSTEQSRVMLNREQPNRVPKYTASGFARSRVPERAWAAITEFYLANRGSAAEVVESWPVDNTYVNHWEVSTTMIHLPPDAKQIVFDDVQPLVEEWSGVSQLVGTSCYGVRHYHKGSVLKNHVDRVDVLVLSVIIHVAREGDETWPLEIYDHDGNVHHIEMQPRDMIFYESAHNIHGRPIPYQGKQYANLFVHFKPHDWSLKARRRR